MVLGAEAEPGRPAGPVSLAVSIITSNSAVSAGSGPALLRPYAASASGERHVCYLPMSGRGLLQVPAAWSCWLIRRPGGR